MSIGEKVTVWGILFILSVIGITLTYGGAVLAGLGGSIYYLAAGLATIMSVVALAKGRPLAVKLFGGLVGVTIVWGLWEVGLDGWALVSRLVAPAVLGLVFLLPPLRKRMEPVSSWWAGGPVLAVVAVLVLSGTVAVMSRPDLPSAAPVASGDSPQGEWHNWGGTLAGTRYSSLSEITAETVEGLEVAWRYDSDVPVLNGRPGAEGTPLAVDGKLYLCLDRNVTVALDQETGEEVWRFDPQTNPENLGMVACRGVSYYEAEPGKTAECPKRILLGTLDSRLVALDAESGALCSSFGEGGTVNLLEGFGDDIPPGVAYPTSPATIVNGVAVIGQFVLDFLSQDSPSGVVRGYDAVTGELRWAWDAARPDRTGLPPAGETYTPNTPNAWSIFSGDEELGLVFVPIGNSPPDYYGGNRSEVAEKYSSSVVALDVKTGKERWSFQTVHHDIWDYDVASQPVVVDIQGPDGVIPALIVPTKQAQIFVLDRRDGTPIDPVEERPVPQGGAPGERLSKTQPFTTGFASVAGPDLTETQMWGVTPLDQMWCRIQFRKARYEGVYTPPSTQPFIHYPSNAGGINWGSVSIDMGRRLMVVNSLHLANLAQLVPQEELVPGQGYVHGVSLIFPQSGMPFAFKQQMFLSPIFAPCQQPPYGRLSVFDLQTRKLLWSEALGTAERAGPLGLKSHLPFRMGAPGMGGALTTGGGLIFIGASQDSYLRAIDIGNGEVAWRDKLPTVGAAVPMTYRSPKSGRQFVVIVAGGYPGMDAPDHATVVAYALPQ